MTKRKSSFDKNEAELALSQINEILTPESTIDLQLKISELEKENVELRLALEDLDVDVDGIPKISTEEYICISQLEKLKLLSDRTNFGKEESEILEKLQKTLKSIRGNRETIKKKPKKATKAELIKLASSNG